MHSSHSTTTDSKNEHIKIYINGELLPRRDAKISVFDSGYLIGDGVWEGIRMHDGVLLFLDAHIKRLWNALKATKINIEMTQAELIDKIYTTVNANNMKNNIHIRLMVTRGIKKIPLQDPRLTIGKPNIVIIAEHHKNAVKPSTSGITLHTSSIKRGSPDYLDPKLNCHSKIHEVQALIQALEAGADEALMLDVNGCVATCNSTNFFMITNNEIWTSTGEYCMNGVTRNNIIEICQQNDITCIQKNFSLYDVYSADEAFVTGSFGGITPITKIDGRNFKYGSMTKKLQTLYDQLIATEIKNAKYHV